MLRRYQLILFMVACVAFPAALSAPAPKVFRIVAPHASAATDSDEQKDKAPKQGLRENLIQYAKEHLGTSYIWGGSSANGFDCSGFTTYVFKKFDVSLPHSSALQAKEGNKIKLEAARRGDLIIFTGTNPKERRPGHVGIVISKPGKPIRFVHSSSVGGVKISNITDGRYTQRFLEIRRVL